jgi:hypothetical protein
MRASLLLVLMMSSNAWASPGERSLVFNDTNATAYDRDDAGRTMSFDGYPDTVLATQFSKSTSYASGYDTSYTFLSYELKDGPGIVFAKNGQRISYSFPAACNVNTSMYLKTTIVKDLRTSVSRYSSEINAHVNWRTNWLNFIDPYFTEEVARRECPLQVVYRNARGEELKKIFTSVNILSKSI